MRRDARGIPIGHSNQVSALPHEQAEYSTYLKNFMNANPFMVADVDGNNFLFSDASWGLCESLANFTWLLPRTKIKTRGVEKRLLKGRNQAWIGPTQNSSAYRSVFEHLPLDFDLRGTCVLWIQNLVSFGLTWSW